MSARAHAFAFALAAGCLSGTAAAAERVVFCATAAAACAGCGRTLGKSANGSWIAIEDGDLIAHTPKARQLPPILYFSTAAYDEAMTGLSGKEKEQAILKRARDQAGTTRPRLVDLVYTDCLDLAIAAGGPDDVAVALDAATVLAGGAESNPDVPLRQVLDRAIQSLANLRAELPAPGAVADAYRLEAEALDDLATGRQGGEGTHSFPFGDVERAYFIPGQKVAKGFDGELPELQDYGWNGGAVSAMRPAEAAALKGPRPKLLYYSNRLFLVDRWSLTAAQFDRRLRARLRGVPAREHATVTARLAFEHTVKVRQYGATLQRRAPDSLSGWNAAVRGELDNLRLVLTAARAPGADPKAARARLRADVALAAFALRTAPEPDPNLPTIERAATVIAKLPPDN